MPETQAVNDDRVLRTERIGLAVTESEKADVKAVAAAIGREAEYSTLLREMSLEQILERAKLIKRALKG